MVELAVRGLRRVRSRHAHLGQPAEGVCGTTAPQQGFDGRRRSGGSHPQRSAEDRARHRRAARAARNPQAEDCGSQDLAGAGPGRLRRQPREEERVGHRRRRLGVRHRLRRVGPRSGERPGCEPARSRHRGLLQHRRPGVQIDAARRRREVRLRRQAAAEERSGHDGHELRQRVRSQARFRLERHADPEGVPRSGGLQRPLAADLLLALHQPRLRPGPRAGSAEGRGAVRLLAAVPLQSGADQAGQESAAARFARAVAGARQVHLQRDPLLHAAADPAGARQGALRPGCGGRQQPLEAVRVHGSDARRWRGQRLRRSATGSGCEGGEVIMDLTTKYLGLNLKNPLVVSASPLSEHLGNIKKMEQAGAAAVVMHSLFEEQIEQDGEALDRSLSTGGSAEAASYFPNVDSYRIGPETYLENLAKAKASVKIPIIASLNGASSGGWTDYAKKMQQAGADAIELNIYTIPPDPRVNAAEIEQRYCDLVKDVKASVQIPVAVKLCPYFSAMVNMAMQLEQAGADGLVLFNRFYQPDFDLEALEVVPSLQLSTPYEL